MTYQVRILRSCRKSSETVARRSTSSDQVRAMVVEVVALVAADEIVGKPVVARMAAVAMGEIVANPVVGDNSRYMPAIQGIGDKGACSASFDPMHLADVTVAYRPP